MNGAWATLWYSVIWLVAYGGCFTKTFAKLNIFRTICVHRCSVMHNADDCLSLYRWYLSLNMIHSYDKRIRYSQKDYAFPRSALPLLMFSIFFFVSKSSLNYPFNSFTEMPRLTFRCFSIGNHMQQHGNDQNLCVCGAESAVSTAISLRTDEYPHRVEFNVGIFSAGLHLCEIEHAIESQPA